MRKKALLICFIGIDGSGKTTLAKQISQELKNRGINAGYTYGRYTPILSKPFVLLGKRIFLKDKDIKNTKEYADTKRGAAKKHSALAGIYQGILLADYTFQLIYRIILPRFLGKTIVCDRYVYDTVINDIPRPDQSIETIRNLIDVCFRIAPKPDYIFLIDLSEDVAYKRKSDTPSIGYLKNRRGVYLELSKEYDMKILNGTEPQEKVRWETIKILEEANNE